MIPVYLSNPTYTIHRVPCTVSPSATYCFKLTCMFSSIGEHYLNCIEDAVIWLLEPRRGTVKHPSFSDLSKREQLLDKLSGVGVYPHIPFFITILAFRLKNLGVGVKWEAMDWDVIGVVCSRVVDLFVKAR